MSDIYEEETIEADIVIKCEDGKYRWMHEYNLWKNPGIIITVGKILLLSSLLPSIIVLLSELSSGIQEAFITAFQVYGICATVILPLLFLAYILVSAINGGKYCVVFEMDETGIRHIQMQKQYDKAKVLSMLGVLLGGLTGNVTAVGSNLLAGSKQSLYCSFKKVKKIVVKKKRHTIYINESFNHNQVYISEQEFDFVLNFLVEHCKKAKVVYK